MILNSKTTKLLLLSSALFLAGIGAAVAGPGHFSSLTVAQDSVLGGKTYTRDLFVNKIDPNTNTSNGGDSLASSTNFSGNVAIVPGQKLLTNEINPVKQDPNDANNWIADDSGTTVMSGNVEVKGVTTLNNNVTLSENNTLFVNEIDPVDSEGITLFSGNVSINQGKKLLVNEINPLDSNNNEDDNLTLQFSSTTAINPVHKLLVNEINPVKDCDGSYVEDDCGTLQLSATTAINSAHKLTVQEINPVRFCDGRYIEDEGGTIQLSGTTALNGNGAKLLANEINPVKVEDCDCSCDPNCDSNHFVENECGFIGFSGNVSVAPGKVWYVNEINAPTPGRGGPQSNEFSGSINVKGDATVSGGVNATSFSADSASVGCLTVNNENVAENLVVAGTTGSRTLVVSDDASVTGDASVDGTLFVNEIDPVECSENTRLDANVIIAQRRKLLVNEINPVRFANEDDSYIEDDNGVTMLLATTAVNPTKKLLVNEISPVFFDGSDFDFDDADDFLIPDPNGTLQLSATTAINPCRKLLVNEINPVAFDEYDNTYIEDDNNITRLSSTVAINPARTLFVNEINPVTFALVRGDNDRGGECCNDVCFNPYVETELNCAQTHFSGNLAIKDTRLFGQLDVTLSTDDEYNTGRTNVLQVNFNNTGTGAGGAFVRLHFAGTVTTAGTNAGTFDIFSEVKFFVYPGNSNDSGPLAGENPEFLKSGERADVDSGFSFQGFTTNCTNSDCIMQLQGSLLNSSLGDTITSFTGTIYYEVVSNNVSSVCSPTPCF